MRSRFARAVVLFALIFSVGLHWFLLQSVAWVGMFARFSQEAPFREAINRTFDGKSPCCVCKFVQEGRDSEQGQEWQKLQVKLDYWLGIGDTPLYAPDPLPPPQCGESFTTSRAEMPPTPPPRLA